MGVRRFDAGVSGDIASGKDKSRATERRDKRGPRRNTWRRQHRIRKVFRLLCQNRLLPESDDSGDSRNTLIQQLDSLIRSERGLEQPSDRIADHLLPYLLRRDALHKELPLHHLGRAIYHLAHRRGYRSNLKADASDKDTGVVKSGIVELEKEMGTRTLGEYFSTLDPEETRIRARWTSRSMYQTEFDKIWTAQSLYHECLTEGLRKQLFAAIFDQRPLKSQKRLVGMCSLEPTQRRAPLACVEVQEYRLLQKVNDLEVIQPDGEIRKLTGDERHKLLDVLEVTKDVTFGKIRQLFGMKKSKEYGRPFTFNFESGGEKTLIGNRTSAKLTEALGDKWRTLDDKRQRLLVNEILSFQSPSALAKRLQKAWGFSEEESANVASQVLEPGYGRLSRKAIDKLLPLLRTGEQFETAKKSIYGDSGLKSAPCEKLPPCCDFNSELNNPAVIRALSELRKVVNAIIKKYGKPKIVRIELARDLKHGRKVREKITASRDQNENLRKNAYRKILEKMGGEHFATPQNILKVRLADECDWHCPYTNKGFGMRELIGDAPQFDIEHIIPFSRSLDNSYVNKTLCYHEENRNRKKSKTPYEAYGQTEQYDDILQRVRFFSGTAKEHKLALFKMQKVATGEEFCSRHLNDTRYIARLAGDYLGLLFGGQIDSEGKRRIQVSPGRVTAYLRQRWQLNSLIGHSDKKDRDDHRHHAIDALVVALTTPGSVRMLSTAAEEVEQYGGKLFAAVDLPWEGFLGEARSAVGQIIVSSRVNRKLNGPLHKDTILSKPIATDGGDGARQAVHHVRKALDQMSPPESRNIADPTIRQLVQEKLKHVGGVPKKVFSEESNLPHLETGDGRIVIVRNARIKKADKPMVVGKKSRSRYVNPGSNHHVEIVAKLDSDGNQIRWDGLVVSRFEAMNRYSVLKNDPSSESVVKTTHLPEGQFMFSLSTGEHVEMVDAEGKFQLYRVTVISAGQLEFVFHSDARSDSKRKEIGREARIRKSPESMRKSRARKVTVNPLGVILPAHD